MGKTGMGGGSEDPGRLSPEHTVSLSPSTSPDWKGGLVPTRLISVPWPTTVSIRYGSVSDLPVDPYPHLKPGIIDASSESSCKAFPSPRKLNSQCLFFLIQAQTLSLLALRSYSPSRGLWVRCWPPLLPFLSLGDGCFIPRLCTWQS